MAEMPYAIPVPSAAAWCSGKNRQRTIHSRFYAGTLDDPSSFRPRTAIFTRNRPAWAVIPPDLTVFETTPS